MKAVSLDERKTHAMPRCRLPQLWPRLLERLVLKGETAMKIFKSLFVVTLALSILAGCSSSPDSAQKSDVSNPPSTQPTENDSKNDQQSGSTVTAEIIKSGVLNNCSIDTETTSVSLVSWDLGKSGHSLTMGDEVLCLKFHVKNNCQEQMEIGNLFHVKTFIDGVESSGFGSDFYGDGRSFNVWESTELRADAEADIFFCYNCSIDNSHRIEIDIFDANKLEDGLYFLSDTVIDTFEFDIE